MITIDVASRIGQSCVEYQDGQAIYEEVFQALTRNEVVTLRFSGSEIFASPFFNSAIGQLLKDFGSDDLDRVVHFENLNTRGQAILRRVIANSKEYYGDPARRRAMDSVLNLEQEDEQKA